MIDKVIINGVDVSGCEFFNPTYECTHNCSMNSERLHSCEGFDCYYKQLQRKEQECEEYKAQAKKYLADYFEENKKCKELKKYKDVVNKLAGLQIILTNKRKD